MANVTQPEHTLGRPPVSSRAVRDVASKQRQESADLFDFGPAKAVCLPRHSGREHAG